MIGIYSIVNVINGKRYIGKSKDIEVRIKAHKAALKKEVRGKDVNRYLFSSVKKYGLDNFRFEVIETHEVLDDSYMKDREIHFMDYYDTCNRASGYNLRRDSSSAHTVHADTRRLLSESNMGENNPNHGNAWSLEQKERMSKIKRQQVEDGVYDWMLTDENRAKISVRTTEMWKDTDKKDRMARKVGCNRSELMFEEYDKVTLVLKRTWNSMQEILDAHPDYFRVAIYSVCNGHKKSYRGSVWRSIRKDATIITTD